MQSRHHIAIACRRAGYTLVDLVIVVLIMGILAAAAGPKFANSMVHFQAESAAKQVAADLRYARQHALQAGVNQPVVFAPLTHSYSLTGLNDIDHQSEPYDVKLKSTRYPASIVNAAFGAGGATVTFDIYGKPDNGGNVVIQVGGEQRTINIDGYTGKVSVSP